MTEKIIIDGVDVAGCDYLNKVVGEEPSCNVDEEHLYTCSSDENCYYKQLQRKTQECEKLQNLCLKLSSKNLSLKEDLTALQHTYKACEKEYKALDKKYIKVLDLSKKNREEKKQIKAKIKKY